VPAAPAADATAQPDKSRLTPADEVALKALDATVEKKGGAPPPHLKLSAGTLVVAISAWRDRCYQDGITDSPHHGTRWNVFNRAVKRLVSLGLVVVDKDFAWRPPSSPSPPAPKRAGRGDLA
jgi:hypothetical protein